MRKLFDYSVYLAFRALWALLSLASLDRTRAFLEGAAELVMRFDARHRQIVADNLALAFPEWGAERRDAVMRTTFRNWGRLVAELLHVEEVAQRADSRPWKELSALVQGHLAGGKGLLVLTAHLGNYEVMARLWGNTGGSVSVFHRTLENPYIDEFLLSRRRAMHVNSIGRGMVLREALRELNAGGVLAVLLDQNQRAGAGIFVETFGREASTSTLLARLSLASKAPVLPVFAVWRNGQTVPECGELIEPYACVEGSAGGATVALTREERIAALTAKYTAEIEAAVRRHPEQWNWAHRRWKTRPRDESAAAVGGESAKRREDK